MKRRILSFLLALSLLCVPALAAEDTADNFVRAKEYTGQFSDLTEDSVFYDNVAALYEYGLSVGKLDGTFGLQDSVTVSQILIFAGRIRSLYRTGDPEAGPAAYQEAGQSAHVAYLRYLQAEQVVGNELEGLYFTAATRSQVAHVLARTLPEAELPLINDAFVTEAYASRVFAADVTEYTPYSADILFLYRSGIVVGSDEKGSFFPDAPITRGAAAAMLTRMVDPELRLYLDWAPVLLADRGLTLADLVNPGIYLETPETEDQMDESIRYMLSRNEDTLYLYYPGLTVVGARNTMQEAMRVLKRYCEQSYNAVAAAILPGDRLQLSFSFTGMGPQAPEYRETAMEAAIAVHDQLWSEKKITRSMTDREKAQVYYEWICNHTTYDHEATENSISHLAYSLFTRGTAVCDGYTGAYNLLLKLEGIGCSALFNEDHIWTVADLDGEIVHIDTTWGDADDAVIDESCFAMTPQESWARHPW